MLSAFAHRLAGDRPLSPSGDNKLSTYHHCRTVVRSLTHQVALMVEVSLVGSLLGTRRESCLSPHSLNQPDVEDTVTEMGEVRTLPGKDTNQAAWPQWRVQDVDR